MYNNVYWEELTSSLAEIRGGKFNVMYLWLVKEWNDIQRMTTLDGCIMGVFKVSTDKQISQIKHKITENIRKLHTIQFKNAVFKWFSDETFKQDIEFDTKKHSPILVGKILIKSPIINKIIAQISLLP